VAGIDEGPFPPGNYPVVVVGSGPGGLQVSYFLRRLGVSHAVISGDDRPAGMFQRFPLFQRLISWTKLYAPFPRGTREYEWYDWNSLLAEERECRSLVPGFMDGTSYFPSRQEMERGIAEFARRTDIQVRYGCRWEGTRQEGDGYALATSDGEYRCRAVVIAVGMTSAWKPSVPGMELAPHYVETKSAKEYADRRVVIIGKRNSGFEVADGLLPWAKRILLVSPRPVSISVVPGPAGATRARYLQPLEDHVFGGGHFVMDAAIERIERHSDGFRVLAKGTTRPGDLVLEADEVIAATGFGAPLQDLPQLGLAVFSQGRLPVQTTIWESATLGGIYFAGNITQGMTGLKKYGSAASSSAVQGYRYNARILARYIAQKHFGVRVDRPTVAPEDLVDFLLAEATRAPELWNQQSYLARIVHFDQDRGIVNDGIGVLAHFVDRAGPDGVAIAVETDNTGDIHPAVYLRRGGRADEYMLDGHPLLRFDTAEHRAQLSSLLKDVLA
jgi:thioredoxin reductase